MTIEHNRAPRYELVGSVIRDTETGAEAKFLRVSTAAFTYRSLLDGTIDPSDLGWIGGDDD